MTTEQKIIAVEATGDMTDIGSAASKKILKTFRYRYSIPIEYTLERGGTFPGVVRGMTVQEVNEALERRKDAVRRRLLSAFKSHGEWLVIQSMRATA